MTCSPEYDCQFVFVTNDTAVLSAWNGGTPSRSSDQGSALWTRWKAYSSTIETIEKASTLRRYTDQRMSASASTPEAR